MKQSAYEKARDQHVADDVVTVDRALMCPAAGCPNRWSVAGDRGRACSAHYWADSRDWPRITQHLQEVEFERARYADAGRPAIAPATLEERKTVVARLHDVVESRTDPRAWARELQRRHHAGEPLSPSKVDEYRRALRLDASTDEAGAW